MSSPDEDEFFAAYAGKDQQFDPLGGHADDSEWALIRKVVTAAGGSTAHAKDLLERFRSACPGQRWPNLQWLRGQVDLPVLFGRRRVPFQADALADIHKRFTKTPCYEAWAQVRDEFEMTTGERPDRPVAVAFRWPGWGDLVIHDRQDDLPEDGTCVVHYHSGTRFVIEPIAGFLSRPKWPPPDHW